MTSLVIDTSALVKYVLPEQDSSVAEKLVTFHRAGTVTLLAPEYLLVESANVLWKHLVRRNILPEEAMESFRTLRELGVRLVPDVELLEDALAFAADNGITVYDSLFCALAVRENVQLITSDGPLVTRMTGTGVQATLLSEWEDSCRALVPNQRFAMRMWGLGRRNQGHGQWLCIVSLGPASAYGGHHQLSQQ